MGMLDNLKNHVNTKSTKQQNQTVSISTDANVMYDIGIKLGKIETSTNSTKNELRRINDRLDNHDKRLRLLEENRKEN